jgi:hypothetical protein
MERVVRVVAVQGFDAIARIGIRVPQDGGCVQ